MFSNKKLLLIKGTMFIAAGMFLVACGSGTPKEEANSVPPTVTDSAATDETAETSYSLPSPLQIASIFKKSGLKYKDGVTSSLKDPQKYTNTISKALNLGVYTADLSYCVLNKQNQEALTYMKLSRQIADNLGMGSVFQESNLSKRFEKNLGNEDSLAYIIAELQMVSDMYLDENEQKYITSVVFAGAWIESLHIGTNVFEKGDKKLNKKLAEQMGLLRSIINALKAEEKKEAAIPGLIADLQTIKEIYDNLASVKNDTSEADDTTKELLLTDDEVSQLTKRIEELRVKFING